MSEVVVINSVVDAAKLYTNSTAAHPLIHVIDLKETRVAPEFLNKRIQSQFYSVVMKRNASGQVRYGRSHYDFDCGVITAYAPGQVIEIEEAYQPGDLEGWSIMFHSDLLLGHPLQSQIKQYGFFSYDVCEALHLSEREQATLAGLASELKQETQLNQDQFSLAILLGHLDLVLKYTDRYFNRQFLSRRPFIRHHVERFQALVDENIAQASDPLAGLPSVTRLAKQMNMSPNYMSDLLRKETGHSAQELIQQQLIDKAKHLLLSSNDSIASIAYRLGFEYPQYFSRMFKKRTTMSPGEFRKLQ